MFDGRVAFLVVGKPPLQTAQLINTNLLFSNSGEMNYVITLQPTPLICMSLSLKPLTYLHRQPKVVQEEKKIRQMIVNQDLKYVIIGNSHMDGVTLRTTKDNCKII